MRYVVMVRGTDSYFCAHGAWRDEVLATRFAAAFNKRIEAYEKAHPDEPDGIAWAYVMPVYGKNLSGAFTVAGLPDLAPRKPRA